MLTSLIQTLRDSPLFHFSLGSKELFHSNFLAWISTIQSPGDPNFGKSIFKSIFESLGVDTTNWPSDFCVRREWKNLDLAVTSNDKKNVFLILENKVKGLPSKTQLQRYDNIKEVKSSKPDKILLSIIPPMEGSLPDVWIHKKYEDLLIALDFRLPDDYTDTILQDYRDFLKALIAIYEEYRASDEYIFDFPEQLRELRISDLLWKAQAERLKLLLLKRLPAECHPRVKTGFTNGTAFVEYWIDDYKAIQIQGSQYRHAVLAKTGTSIQTLAEQHEEFIASNLEDLKKNLKNSLSAAILRDLDTAF